MTTTDELGRALYVCQDCGKHYLPPSAMAYPDCPASEVFCATCAPDHSPAETCGPGLNLADDLPDPRSRGPRRAGSAPVGRSRTGRSRLN